MNNENYIVITGWMVNNFELKGSELLIYALIYGFSQDGESKFYGSRKYIAEWFNCSLPTVDKALNGLLEKNLIIKIEETINGVKFNRFICNKEILGGSKETLQDIKKLYRGSKETLHNNTIYNTSNINNNIYKHFENIFVRTLNGIEVQMIDKWLEDKTPDEIINAINECAKSNIDNFKYIEKVLYSRRKKANPSWFDKEIETEELEQDLDFKNFIEDFRK